MFCDKTENKSISKIYKRTLRVICDTEDAAFEDLLEKDNSRTISPPIMWNFFEKCNLCGNYLLKLSATNTCRYGIQALCFKGSLLWNKIPNKYKNRNSLEEFKSQIKQWNPTFCSPVAVKFVKICIGKFWAFFDRDHRRDHRKIILMVLSEFE